jgi:hypothetical protein
MGTSPTLTTTKSWLENAPTTEARAMTPQWKAVPWLDTDLPFKRCHAHLEEKRVQTHAQPSCVE